MDECMCVCVCYRSYKYMNMDFAIEKRPTQKNGNHVNETIPLIEVEAVEENSGRNRNSVNAFYSIREIKSVAFKYAWQQLKLTRKHQIN